MFWVRSLMFNVVFFTVITVTMIIGYPQTLWNDRRRVFAFWRRLSRMAGFIAEKVGGISYEVEREENILEEPAIYAVRHESIWETLVLIQKFFEPIFVLKEELLKIPFFGALSSAAGTIAIDRNNGARSLMDMVGKVELAIRSGHAVVIFPEGTRMASGETISLKRGIALFYSRCNCPVVPVIHNSGRFWPRRGFLKKPGTISVKFLDPILPGLSKDEFMDKLNRIFYSEVKKMQLKR